MAEGNNYPIGFYLMTEIIKYFTEGTLVPSGSYLSWNELNKNSVSLEVSEHYTHGDCQGIAWMVYSRATVDSVEDKLEVDSELKAIIR